MNVLELSRSGLVRDVGQGCATIEVSVPCGGCRQIGCSARRSAGAIQLPGTDLRPGEVVQLSIPANRLTAASLRLFGPPLVWMALSGLALTTVPNWSGGQSVSAVLFGSGMVMTVLLGNWLGRHEAATTAAALKVDRTPVAPTSAGPSA